MICEEEVMILGGHESCEMEPGSQKGKFGEKRFLKRLIGNTDDKLMQELLKMSGHLQLLSIYDKGNSLHQSETQIKEQVAEALLANPGNFWRGCRLWRIQEVQMDYIEWPLRWKSW